MPTCPYCDEEKKARGLKNHVRLASSGNHGEKGAIPETFEEDLNADSDASDDAEPDSTDAEPSDADESGENDAQAVEVTADDLTADPDEEADSAESEASEDGDEFPFDPDDENALRLDGDEEIYVRVDGEVIEAEPADGDYLLITDNGPVLWDKETDERYEVVTA